jgi:hypothetical protein
MNLSNTVGHSLDLSIAVSGDNVYVVWQEDQQDSLGNHEIFYIRSTDAGAMFDSVINISDNAAFSGAPSIAASGNNVYVVWIDQGAVDQGTGGQDIFYRRSTDGGTSFEPQVSNLSAESVIVQPASIAVS